MRRNLEKLNDVLEAIEQIEKYRQKGKNTFESDELIQVWMLHYLQIIGEAARSTSLELKKDYPQVPWAAIVGF
mgnify:CR=1 FL=1